MSKLTDIEYRIDQLDGGAFQNLCNAYLACRGYGTGYSLGTKTGTDKTAKGNPDTYFLTESGKYVFVMYTTQKNSFVSKALEDLSKCFDPDKTGVQPEDVSEIVYCHTFGRLSPGNDQQLRRFCEERNAVLTLVGLDVLGNDLYLRYPRLAKDFLNISVDTGQITSMREFIQTHDANKISAPLDTEFLIREEELKLAKDKLRQSDVLILSGPAGVGKTRLALELCRETAVESGFEVLCIKSNGLELFEDLIASIETNKNYLVFVDDANELTGLHFVLDFLPKAAAGQKCIQKIILTVRNYARRQVLNQVLEVEKPEILQIGSFKDEEIKKLIETAFGIKNHLYSDRIVTIAEGNARLAMLAGKIAAETEQLESIQDATELYEHYYGKQIGIITGSTTGIASAGIMAFFQTLRLDGMERLRPLFDAIDLTENQFISDLKQLHELELLDLCQDKAARISDQSFSNYLIKYAFIDKKVIPLDQMIECCFFIHKEKAISACSILLNVFSEQSAREYVEQQINIVWDRLQPHADSFFPFFKAFYMVRPTEALVLLKEQIEREVPHIFDLQSIDFRKTAGIECINDGIINILCGFCDHSQLPEAVELLLLYYQKRPDLFEQVYRAFVFRFGVDKDSLRFGYFTQTTVVNRLCAAVEADPTDEILVLFVRVAEQFLKLSFSRTESGRKNTVTFYTVPLSPDEPVLTYRKALLEQIYKIYEGGKCRNEIEGMLADYCETRDAENGCEIITQELDAVLRFFSLFSPENLYHCVITEHIAHIAAQVGYDCGEMLTSFQESRKYRIYHVLKIDHSKMLDLSFHEYEAWHKEQVQAFVQGYGLREFQYLLQVCKECLETVDRDARQLSQGLKYAIEAFSGNTELYIDVVSAYMVADTPYPYNICSREIVRTLFNRMPAESVKRLIDSHVFSQKNVWLWDFYVELPVDQISVAWADDFLLYLEDVPQHMHSSPYRPLDEMEKFECIDQDIIPKASRVILSHYEKSPFVFSLYFSLMMNSRHADACKVVAKYEDDLPLLEDIYLKCVAYSNHEDYDGCFLAAIIQKDPDFLNRYLDRILEREVHFRRSHDEWVDRLTFIWKEDAFASYINRISDYAFAKAKDHRGIYDSVIGHLLLRKQGEDDIVPRQEKWIQDTIEKHCFDHQRMYCLFSAIDEHSADRRRCALEQLLRLNNDYALFEKLPLEASHWGGWGSMIPHMQKRIEYLTSLLPMLSGVQYLKHRQKIERDIACWKSRIKSQEIEELLSL